MHGGHACLGEVHRTPRVGACDRIGIVSLDDPDLAVTDLPSKFGLKNRVRTTGAATKTIVVEFDELPHKGRENGSSGLMHSLNVPQMAGVLHGHAKVERFDRWKGLNVIGKELADIEYPR